MKMPNTRLLLLIGLIATVIFGLTAMDLLREPVFPPWGEVALDLAEKLMLVGAMAAVAWTVHGLVDLRAEQEALSNNIARSVAQGDAWRAQRRGEIAALGQAIEDQFRQWRLTGAEIDVAGLMLKGMSLKEIAIARDTSEATIRQQAQAIYRKSGLSGRAELAAYFLESLFEVAEDTSFNRPNLSVIAASAD
jgi:DNA-binding CsgD family transcriptional regulator